MKLNITLFVLPAIGFGIIVWCLLNSFLVEQNKLETGFLLRRVKRTNNYGKLNIQVQNHKIPTQINPESFLNKHVTINSYPDTIDTAENLLSSLYTNIGKDKFYARDKQTLTFPTNFDDMKIEILQLGQNVLSNNPKIEKLEIKNQPYLDSIAGVEGGKYDQALDFLTKNNNAEIKTRLDTNIGGSADKALLYLESIGTNAVKKMLDSHVDNSVIFEIKEKIKLKKGGKSVLVERLDGTGGSSSNRPPTVEDIQGWKFSDTSNQPLEVTLYAKVTPKQGQSLDSVSVSGITEWQLHFSTDAPPPSNTGVQIKYGNKDKIEPRFFKTDQFNRKQEQLIQTANRLTADFDAQTLDLERKNLQLQNTLAEIENKKREIEKNYKDLESPDIVLAKTALDDVKSDKKAKLEQMNKLEKELKIKEKNKAPQNEIDALKDNRDNVRKEVAILDDSITKHKNDLKDVQDAHSQRPDVQKAKDDNKKLKNQIKDLEIEATRIQNADMDIIQSKLDDLRSRETNSKKYKRLLTEEKNSLASPSNAAARKDFDQHMKKLSQMEIDVFKQEAILLHKMEQYSEAKRRGVDKTTLDGLEADIKAKSEALTDAKGKIKKSKEHVITKIEDALDRMGQKSTGCPSGRRKRRSTACMKTKSKKVPVDINPQKLERSKTKREKFRDFMEGIFSRKENKMKNKPPPLKDITETKGLKNKIKSSKFLKDILGITEINQVYMGKKTMQKALAPHKGGFRSKVGKVSKAFEKANYAFLIRDFTKAAITGNTTTMAIMGSMTGVQIVASGLAKAAKSGTFTLKTAKGLMVASRITSGVLVGVGLGFDIYSLVNSGKCLKMKSDNAELCRKMEEGCATENEICEGRDAVADIVLTSISMIDGIVSLAFPPAAPFIAIFSLFLTIFGEIYQANRYLDNFEKDIPLLDSERTGQLGRRLIGMNISDYLVHLKEQKRINTRALESIREFLLEHSDVFWAYFAPGLDRFGKPIENNKVKVRDEDWQHRDYHRWSPDPNRLVEGSKIYKITDYNYFCRPVSSSRVKNVGFLHGYSYYCEDAVGIRIQTKKSVKELYALFKLEGGDDSVVGFQQVPNYFEVKSGTKDFAGGEADDLFVIEQGFNGQLLGQGGSNSLHLSDNMNDTHVELNWINQHKHGLKIGSHSSLVDSIQYFKGRKGKGEKFSASCSTKHFDGLGGEDEIIIEDLMCSEQLELRLEIRARTKLINKYVGKGFILYNLHEDNSSTTSVINIAKSDEETINKFYLHEGITQLYFPRDSCMFLISGKRNHKISVSIGDFCSSDYLLFLENEKGETILENDNKSGNIIRLNFTAFESQIQLETLANGETFVLSATCGTESCLQIKHEFISSELNLLPRLITSDGAVIVVSRNSRSDLIPHLYFHLNSDHRHENVRGCKLCVNTFDIENGSFNEIHGGNSNDEFIFNPEAKDVRIKTLFGNGGDDSLILRESENGSTYPIQIDMNLGFIASKIQNVLLRGPFANILGRQNGSESVILGCYAKVVDLKEGPEDSMIFPEMISSCPNIINTQVHLWPGTKFNNYYKFHDDAHFIYLVHEGSSEVNIHYPILSTRFVHFIQFLTTKAQDLDFNINKTDEKVKLTLKGPGTNVEVNLQNLTTIMSEDGGVLIFPTQTNENEKDPIFYFDLNEQSKYKGQSINGSKKYSNIFKISTSFDTISSFAGNASNFNHFIIENEAQLKNIVATGISNVLELNISSTFVPEINLPNATLTIGGKHDTKLSAEFHSILGKNASPEHLILGKSVQMVDLRGGNQEKKDKIYIPSANYNVTIAIRSYSFIQNNGEGQFYYLVSNDQNIQAEIQIQNPTNSTQNFKFEYLAKDIFLEETNDGLIISGSQIYMNIIISATEFDPWENVQGITDNAKILFGKSSFLFQLTGVIENETMSTVYGGTQNSNYFYIDQEGIDEIHGGTVDDTFILQDNALVNSLHGEGGDDTIIFHESIDESLIINLPLNYVQYDQSLKLVELNGNFVHVVGRASAPEFLIVDCNTKTINLQGGGDTLVVPPGGEDCNYDLLIDVQPMETFRLINGQSNPSKFIYSVDERNGDTFQLINVFDPYEDGANVEHIWSIKSSFFELSAIEIVLEVLGIRLDVNNPGGLKQITTATFLTHQFSSYAHIAREYDLEELEETITIMNDCFGSENNTLECQKTEDEDFVIKIPHKFPSILTSDNYRFFINHLGGIHAVSTLVIDENEKDYLEIIQDHIGVVNNLGISLFLTILDSNDVARSVITFGGDDEMDALINDRTLPSHLVANVGEGENIFLIFPTETQVPVSIYIYEALNPDPKAEEDILTNEREIILNLSSFFDVEFPELEENKNFTSSSETSVQTNSTKPKLILPEIIQNEDDLEIWVRYVSSSADLEQLLEQKITFVDGVNDYKKMQVLLYAVTYTITKNSSQSTWGLQPMPLRLKNYETKTTESHSHRSKRSTEEKLSEEDDDFSKYVFLSFEDIREYKELSLPLLVDANLNSNSMDGVYRNGDDLILTNKFDPNPSLGFDLCHLWLSDCPKDQLDQDHFTIILVDMKNSMEEEQFTFGIQMNGEVGEGKGDHILDVGNFDRIIDYETAVKTSNHKKEQNKMYFNIIFSFVLILCLVVMLAASCYAYRQFHRRGTYFIEEVSRDYDEGDEFLELQLMINEPYPVFKSIDSMQRRL